jgi:hypothetical protein
VRVAAWLEVEGCYARAHKLQAMYFHVTGLPQQQQLQLLPCSVCACTCRRARPTCMHSYHQRHRGQGSRVPTG